MQALPLGALALPDDATQVRCICFHPSLQTAYIAIASYVIEYDLNTQARLSTFKLPANNIIALQFLQSHQAWVAIFEDGKVMVVAGATVISELHCTKSNKEKWAISCTTVQDNLSLPMLFFVRKGSKTVQGGPLLSQSKALWRFEGHKKPIMMIASHPSYPLLAAAADNGTIRIWRTDVPLHPLYNVVEAGRKQGSKAGIIVTVALQFDRVPPKSRKTSEGASPRKTGKKKLRTISVFFSKVRLIVAHEKGAIFLFDVSIPGAPQTLRTLHNPSAVFLNAHLHPALPGLMFTLDSTGLYTAYSFSADPTLEGKSKGSEMNFIQLADHMEPFQVSIAPKAHCSVTSEWSVPDEDGIVTSPALLPTTLKAHMHPTSNYVIFTGEFILPPGRADNLAIYRYHQAPGEPGDLHPIVAPMVLPKEMYFPAPRWLSGKSGPTVPSNSIFFIDSAPPMISLKMFAINTQAVSTLVTCKLPVTIGAGGERVPVMHHNALRLVVSNSTVMRKEPGPRFLLFIRAAMSRTSGGLVKLTARTRGLFPTAAHSTDCQYRYLFTLLPHVAISCTGAPAATPADPWCFLPGMDGGFVGPDDTKFLILDEHGFKVTLYSSTKEQGTNISLPEHASRIFITPLGGNCVVLYFKPGLSELAYSANHQSYRNADTDTLLSSTGLQPSGPSIPLLKEEVPLQVKWQPDVLRGNQSDPSYLVALLTTSRLLLLRDNLVVLSNITPNSPLKSIFWVGRTLIYNTATALQYVTTDGLVQIQTSIPPDSTIVGTLHDRVIGASKEEGKTSLWFKHLHLIDPLLHGICTDKNGDDMVDDKDRYSLLKHITARFDCSKVSPSVFSRLCASGFNDLSLQLGQQMRGGKALAETLSWQDRFHYYLEANDVATALSILTAVYLSHVTNDGTMAGTSKEEGIPETSPFFAAFLELLCRSVAVDSQQVASKSLKMINNVFLVLKNLKKNADIGALQYVATHCEKAAPHFVPLAQALLRSLEGCGSHDVQEPPKRDWTLCTQVSEVRLLSLVSPQEADEDWREEEVTVTPLGAGNLLQLLGVPPIDGIASGADDAQDQVDYGTADWGGDFTSGDDTASSVGPDDYQTESLGDEYGDDDLKATPSNDSMEGGSKEKEGSDDDEDAVSKEQEELRRQYLASYSGNADEDEDSDEDGMPRKPRMKIKFKISDTAVVKPQAPVGAISIGMAMPTPSASKRKPGRAGIPGPGSTSAPPPAEEQPEPQQSQQSPVELFREGLAFMDKGKFAEALRYVTTSCDLLVQDPTQISKKTQIISVIQYKAALSILIKIKELEGPPGCPPPSPEVAQQLAFLTLLVVQMSLLPKHQLICQKMASRKNFDAGNWHGASRILKELIPAAPEKVRAQLEEELHHCEANGNTSTLPEPTRRDKINFCWETFKLLRVPGESNSPEEAELSPASICTYCPAMFDALLRPPNNSCPVCKYGQLEQPFQM